MITAAQHHASPGPGLLSAALGLHYSAGRSVRFIGQQGERRGAAAHRDAPLGDLAGEQMPHAGSAGRSVLRPSAR